MRFQLFFSTLSDFDNCSWQYKESYHVSQCCCIVNTLYVWMHLFTNLSFHEHFYDDTSLLLAQPKNSVKSLTFCLPLPSWVKLFDMLPKFSNLEEQPTSPWMDPAAVPLYDNDELPCRQLQSQALFKGVRATIVFMLLVASHCCYCLAIVPSSISIGLNGYALLCNLYG